MKQRYTITIADMEINVISDESPETVESLVGSVDRKMREILVSSRRCSKSEAALLCALDYCSDKVQALRKVKQNEATIDMQNNELQALRRENDKLRVEIETLRESLLAVQAHKQENALAEEPVKEIEAAPDDKFEQIALDVTEAAETAEAASTEEATADTETAVEQPQEAVEPEDVDFDPTEIFRRVKANRSIRKGGKRKA